VDLGLQGIQCSSSSATEGPTTELGGFWPVVPPPELQGSGVTAYYMTDGAYVPDPALQAVYAAWGFGKAFRPGTVALSPVIDGVGKASGSDPSGGVDLQWVVPGQPGAAPPGRLRVFVVDAGHLPFVLLGAFDEAVQGKQLVQGGPAAVTVHGSGSPLQVQGQAGLAFAATVERLELFPVALPPG
jgi:hypothetical protein